MQIVFEGAIPSTSPMRHVRRLNGICFDCWVHKQIVRMKENPARIRRTAAIWTGFAVVRTQGAQRPVV